MDVEDYLDEAGGAFEDGGAGDEADGGAGGEEDGGGGGARGTTSRSLLRQHPEVVVPSREELRAGLERGRRITYPFLTIYERTKVLSLRASQLAKGAPPLVPVTGNGGYAQASSPLLVAMAELQAGALPFVLRRPLPDGSYEYVRLRELTHHQSCTRSSGGTK